MLTSSRLYGLPVRSIPQRRRSRRRVKCKACSSVGTTETETAASETQSSDVARVAVLGASGYTGSEVTRLLAQHPKFRITAMTADRQAGKPYPDVYPHLVTMTKLPDLVKVEDVDFGEIDSVFCCLPHGMTQSVIASVPERVKVVDLSADFRLRDPEQYKEWLIASSLLHSVAIAAVNRYGTEHVALDLQEEAVYGLTEVNRNLVKNSRLIANPGCYPTSCLLPLIPLLRADLIDATSIVIDSKSGTDLIKQEGNRQPQCDFLGVSGAGRAPKESKLFCEVTEGMHAYGVSNHRHTPEIEQELSDAAGFEVNVTFTPHLIPMSRGMLSTIYVQMIDGIDANALRAAIDNFYSDEIFVKVLNEGVIPHTHHVRGSNFNLINVFDGRCPGQAIILSVIDNLVKGASGQALQNMNLIMGIDESVGLLQQPMFP